MKKIALFLLLFVGFQSVKAQENPPSVAINPPDTNKPFLDVDGGQAEFVGGKKALNKYLEKNIIYPKSAIDSNKQGAVYLLITISKKGTIEKIKILKGVSNAPELDSSAVNVVRNMPNWIPGKRDGINVESEYYLPIKYILDDAEKKK